jgi:hypothetical protein
MLTAPGAFVVQNVCANLANLFRFPGKVKVIVLDLEVLAKGQENVKCKLIVVVRISLVLYFHSR